MTSFKEFLEQRDPNFLTEMDRREFLGAIGAAGAAAFLGGNAQAQTNKMTPEELYELVKPPVANFTSFVKPIALGNADDFDLPNRNNPNQPKKEKPTKSFLNSPIYKMNNIAPNYTEQLKKYFLDIATRPNGSSIQQDAIKSIFNNEDTKKNLELLKHYMLKSSQGFFEVLPLRFVTSKGGAEARAVHDIFNQKRVHAKEDYEPLIDILKKETNNFDDDVVNGNPEFKLACQEFASNIRYVARKYDKLAKEAFSKYKSID